jgi:hypothetical protein
MGAFNMGALRDMSTDSAADRNPYIQGFAFLLIAGPIPFWGVSALGNAMFHSILALLSTCTKNREKGG